MTFVTKLSWIVAIFVLAFSWTLTASAATTHVFTCADMTYGADASCTGDVFTLPATNFSSFYDATPMVNVYGGSFYVTAIITSNTGTSGKIDCGGSCGSVSPNTFSASFTDKLVSFPLGFGPTAGIDITNNSNSFDGVISYLCVSDTIGACSPPAPPVPEINYQQAVPWALSSLAFATSYQALYFGIFFMAMYLVFAGIAFIYRVIVYGIIR